MAEIAVLQRALQATKGKKKKIDGFTTPGGAYGCFFAKNRLRFKKLCAGMKGSSVMVMAGTMWKEMDEVARRPYQEEFLARRQQREEHKLEHAFAKARRSMRRSKIEDEVGGEPLRKRVAVAPGAKGAADAKRVTDVKRVRPECVLPLLAPGARVLLHGLTSAAELNGCQAKVHTYDASACRYVVDLTSTEQKRVRPEHLLPCFNAGVQALLLKSTRAGDAAEKRSRASRVQVQHFDPKTRQYFVHMLPRKGSELTPAGPLQIQVFSKAGEYLLLRGLVKTPELNDRQAQVLYFDDAAGCYVVQVVGGDRNQSIKPENTRPQLADGSEVLLQGLEHAGDLNGKQARLDSFKSSLGRYLVSGVKAEIKDEPPPACSQPRRLLMSTKVQVVILGQHRAPELNGQVGFVEDIDEGLGMYVVRLPACARLELLEPKYVCQWLPPSAEVAILGLPKYDGQTATIESFRALNGEYVVRLNRNAELLVVRPTCIFPWLTAPKKVVLVGFRHAKELDGRAGKIEGFDWREGRYLVELAGTSKRRLLHPENLRALLPKGAKVKIDGLQNSLELNGKRCTIKRFDKPCRRYIVHRVHGEVGEKRVRPENLFESVGLEASKGNSSSDDEALEPEHKSGSESECSVRTKQPGSPVFSESSDSSGSPARGCGSEAGPLARKGPSGKIVPKLIFRDSLAQIMKAGQRAAAEAPSAGMASSLNAFGLGHLGPAKKLDPTST